MPLAIGAFLVADATAAEIGATIGVSAVAVQSAVGTAVITGASLAAAGISAALAPGLPKPAAGYLTKNSTLGARQSGYGRARLSGFYMLYESVSQDSIDVVAFHQGKICGVVGYFLNDDRVTVVATAVTGVVNANGSELPPHVGNNDGRYLGRVNIDVRLGLATETVYSGVTALVGSGMWDATHRGDTVASLSLKCEAPSSTKFTAAFPQGLPSPSVIADLLALWDFRDSGQDPDDPTTWVDYPAYDPAETVAAGVRRVYGGVVYISQVGSNTGNQPDISPPWWVSAFSNPVLQIVDYLTDTDHGMGQDRATLITPVLARLIVEANKCDVLVETFPAWDSGKVYAARDEVYWEGAVYTSLADGNTDNPPSIPAFWLFEFYSSATEPTYKSDGFFTFDNEPADVLPSILATCNGWLAFGVDGALVLQVGQYSAPTVALGLKHIYGGEVRRGLAEKDSVNELQITFTDPTQGYKAEPAAPYRDEDDITARGKVLSKALQLTWVQSQTQARRLAARQMAMFQAPLRGTLIASSYGLAALGERYISIDWPVHGLNAQVVEVQKIAVDLLAGTTTIDWIAVDPDTIDTPVEMVSNQITNMVLPSQPAFMLDFSRTPDSLYLGAI